MKISKRIVAAEEPKKTGTTFYAITKESLSRAFDDDDVNVWLKAVVDEEGFDALDLENNLFGSKVIGDTFYLCITDGRDILIDGKATDPEEALDKYSPEQLSDFIAHATEKLIRRYITEYEIYDIEWEDSSVDNLAIKLLDEGYSFYRLAKDYSEFS